MIEFGRVATVRLWLLSLGDATIARNPVLAHCAAWAAAQSLPHVGYARLVQDGQAIYYYPAHG